MKKLNRRAATALSILTVKDAVQGDAGAINEVLKHFEGYIYTLSIRPLYDEYGGSHSYVDEELRSRLQTKLITAIPTFNLA